MVQFAQNQEMATGWQGYATAVILRLASRFTLRGITSSNVALDLIKILPGQLPDYRHL